MKHLTIRLPQVPERSEGFYITLALCKGCSERGARRRESARARSDKGALIGQRCKGRDRSLGDGVVAKGAGLAPLREPCPFAKRGRLPPELGAGVLSIIEKGAGHGWWAGVSDRIETRVRCRGSGLEPVWRRLARARRPSLLLSVEATWTEPWESALSIGIE